MLRVPKILDEIQGNLLIQAKALLNGCISQANNLNALKSITDSKGGFVMCGWCEDQECELRIKEATGADIRVIPFVGQDLSRFPTCVYCESKASRVAMFAQAY
jgi:prolyl-tRNA synthetase